MDAFNYLAHPAPALTKIPGQTHGRIEMRQNPCPNRPLYRCALTLFPRRARYCILYIYLPAISRPDKTRLRVPRARRGPSRSVLGARSFLPKRHHRPPITRACARVRACGRVCVGFFLSFYCRSTRARGWRAPHFVAAIRTLFTYRGARM